MRANFFVQDNRAMTIKDLSELCMKFGLMCQKYALCSLYSRLDRPLTFHIVQRVCRRPSYHDLHPESPR